MVQKILKAKAAFLVLALISAEMIHSAVQVYTYDSLLWARRVVPGPENRAGTRWTNPWFYGPHVLSELRLENKRMNEQADHTKWRVCWRKSKSVMVKVTKEWGWGPWPGKALQRPCRLRPDTSQRGRHWADLGDGALSRAWRPDWVLPVRVSKELRGAGDSEGVGWSSRIKAAMLWEAGTRFGGVRGWLSLKLIPILAGGVMWT